MGTKWPRLGYEELFLLKFAACDVWIFWPYFEVVAVTYMYSKNCLTFNFTMKIGLLNTSLAKFVGILFIKKLPFWRCVWTLLVHSRL